MKSKRVLSFSLCVILLLAGHPLAQSLITPSPSSETPPGANISPEDPTKLSSDNSSVIDKLTNFDLIVGPFEQGSETVEVIVNLVEPKRLSTAFRRNTQSTPEERRYEIVAAQDRVLTSISSRDFQVDYVFENQAALSGEVTLDGLAQLMNDPTVDSIEPVYPLKRLTKQGISLMKATIPRQTHNGRGVAIAVIDDGFDYTHPKLGGGGFPNNKVIGGYDFGDPDGNYDSDPAPGNGDLNFHGTPCAGLAAGDTGTTGDYIGGVATGAKIYALKVADDDGNLTNSGGLARALDWCISHKNDDPQNPILVITISLGFGKYYSQSSCDSDQPNLARSIRNASSSGITVLAGSGNEGYCNAMPCPAALSGVISVGSVYDADIGRYPASGKFGKISSDSCAGYSCTDNPEGKCFVDYSTGADRVPTYSNTSSFLDIFAPANKAHTLDVTGPQGKALGSYYSSFGGTSAASPYAAGAVACLQSASKALQGKYLSPSEVRATLTSTGDNVTDTKPATDITKPRVNLERAIDDITVHDVEAADNFNRPNSTNMGPNWTEREGNWRIDINRAECTAGSAENDIRDLMTFASAVSSEQVISADVFYSSDLPRIAYAALVSGYADLDNNIFVKVQDNPANGNFNRVFFYYGNNGSAWSGITGGTSENVTPFTSARLTTRLVGDTITLEIDHNFDGVPEETLTRGGIPLGSLGDSVGLGGLDNAKFDNFTVNAASGGSGGGGTISTIDPTGMVFVHINDSGFNGDMSKYETTNAQYCQYLNAALSDGLIVVLNDLVYATSDTDHSYVYFPTYGDWSDFENEISQITYSGGTFRVRSRNGHSMANHPVVLVSWYGAAAFCNYYSYRLPTRQEWQAVADFDGSYTYGCGATLDHSRANYGQANPLGLGYPPHTTPVGHYPAYGYGLCDMAGNVFEWTSASSYSYRTYLRGGGWRSRDSDCTVSSSLQYRLTSSTRDSGFRVCR